MQDIKIPEGMKPIYADEVKMDVGIKVHVTKPKSKKEKDKIRKEAKFELIFFDSRTREAVARVVIDPITAQRFGNMLSMHSAKIMNELHSKEIPKEVKKQMKKKEKEKEMASRGYIG